MTRLRPPPRVMMSARVHETYRKGLETTVAQLRKEGYEDAQKYDVLEMLLEDLTTPEGRKRVKALFREKFGPESPGTAKSDDK